MKSWRSLFGRRSAGHTQDGAGDEGHRLIRTGYGHLQLGEYNQARVVLLQAAAFRDTLTKPSDVESLLGALASTWHLTEQYEDGLMWFSDYIAKHASDFAAYRARGSLLWYSGQCQEAVQDYSHALELKPGDVVCIAGRGQVLAELGESEKALRDLDEALRSLRVARSSNPRWSRWHEQIQAFAHNGRGLALAALADKKTAMEEFDLSISLCPGNAWVYHNRAKVHDLSGDQKKAIADYKQALAKHGPSLNTIRRLHAQSRLADMGESADG